MILLPINDEAVKQIKEIQLQKDIIENKIRSLEKEKWQLTYEMNKLYKEIEPVKILICYYNLEEDGYIELTDQIKDLVNKCNGIIEDNRYNGCMSPYRRCYAYIPEEFVEEFTNILKLLDKKDIWI